MAVMSYIDAITLAMKEEMNEMKRFCSRRRCWTKRWRI